MVAQEEMMVGMVRCERPVDGDKLVGSRRRGNGIWRRGEKEGSQNSC